MPAVRVSTSSRKGLLVRYDSLIEVVDVDTDHPEEEFGQGGMVAESSVCGRARLLWTRAALQEPENEMATRLAHQRVHGDALLVFHHDVPWLKAVDSSKQYPMRTLLQISLSHAPGGLEKHTSHPVRPCIRTLVASILSSQAFPPRIGHKEPPQPYLPHGAAKDAMADAIDHHPPRASFDLATTSRAPTPTAQPDEISAKTDRQAQGPATQPASSLTASTTKASATQVWPSQPPPSISPSAMPYVQAQLADPQPAPSPAPPASSASDSQAQPAVSPPAPNLTAVPRRKRQTNRDGLNTPSSASTSTAPVYKQSSRRHEHPDGNAAGCPGCNPPPQIHAIHAYLEKKKRQKEEADRLAQQAAEAAPAPASSTAAAEVPESRKHGAAHAADDDDLASHKRAHLASYARDRSTAGTSSKAAQLAASPPANPSATPAGPLVPPAATSSDPLGLQQSPAVAQPLEPIATAAGPSTAPQQPALSRGGAGEMAVEEGAPVEAPRPLAAAAGGGGLEAEARKGDWEALHPDVLHFVFLKLNCQDLVAASGACAAWRSAAVRDRQALEVLQVKLAPQPLRAASAALGAVIGIGALTRLQSLQLPRVVRAAADTASCPSACFTAASVCEVRADLVGAAGYWKKAAKGGIAAAMYKLGTHFYRGDIASLGRSGEDAVTWLQRFLKAVDPASASAKDSAAARSPSQVSLGDLAAAEGAGAAAEADDDAAAADAGGGMLGAVGRSARARQRQANSVLDQQIARASLLLGYLHMDGEGTKTSNVEAVRHMRRAAMLGDEEAHRTLGWMYNTGQFGEGS